MSAPIGYRREVGKVKENRIEYKVEENWVSLGWTRVVNDLKGGGCIIPTSVDRQTSVDCGRELQCLNTFRQTRLSLAEKRMAWFLERVDGSCESKSSYRKRKRPGKKGLCSRVFI